MSHRGRQGPVPGPRLLAVKGIALCQGATTSNPQYSGGVWHEAMVLGCLPLAVAIGPSPLHIPTLCGSERVLVVSTEPLNALSCFTTPRVGCPGDGLLPVPLTRCIQMHTPSPCRVCRLQH